MTLELVDELAVVQAEARRQEIRAWTENINEACQTVLDLVGQAKESNDWEVLGFQSWPAYLVDLFGDQPFQLTRETRRLLVSELSDQGLSTRAIAPIVGVDNKTVHRDLQSGVANATPEETDSIQVNPFTGEIVDAPITEERTETIKTKTTIGLDGKEYKTSTKPKPVVDPVQQNAEEAAINLGKALSTAKSLQFEHTCKKYLDEWLPLGREAVPPILLNLIQPAAIRNIADGLLYFANELERNQR